MNVVGPRDDAAQTPASLIYVVEDDAAISKLVVSALHEFGFATEAFRNGASVLRRLQTERPEPETDLLVDSADEAVARFVEAGGRVVAGPFDIQVGRCAVVADPWGNILILLDLSKGRLVTDGSGNVVGNEPPP